MKAGRSGERNEKKRRKSSLSSLLDFLSKLPHPTTATKKKNDRAYIKAAWRMLWARVFFCFSKVTFKATAKGKGKLAVSIVGDVWLLALFFTLLAVSVGVAVWQLVAGADPLSPLLISVLWATYAAVPPALLLLYALLGPGLALAVACKFCALLSTGASVAAVGLLWAIKDFKPQQGAGGIIKSQTIGLAFRNFGKKVSQTLAPPPPPTAG